MRFWIVLRNINQDTLSGNTNLWWLSDQDQEIWPTFQQELDNSQIWDKGQILASAGTELWNNPNFKAS